MQDIKIRQGETLSFPVKESDQSALTAQFIVKNQDDTIVLDVTEPFLDDPDSDKKVATFSINDTDLPLTDGDTVNYHFNIVVTYEDDVVEIYPQADCDGECGLPELIICESITAGVS